MGIGLFIVTVVAAVAIIAIVVNRRTNDKWQQAARTLGLEFRAGNIGRRRQMTGVVGVTPVSVYTFTRRSGNNSSTYTAVEASMDDLGLGLQVSREGTLHRIGKLFGFQDIETGNASVDDTMTVKGGDAEQVRAFLTPARSAAIQHFLESYRHGKISDHTVTITQSGTVADPQRLVSAVRRAASLAEVLAGRTTTADKALRLRQRGYLQAAADAFEAVAGDPWQLDNELTAAETLRSAGKDDAAADILRRLETEVPADPLVQSWAGTSSPKRPDSGPPLNVDQEAVAAEMFNPALMSFDAMTLFEERYRGATVTWTGTIHRAKRFKSDRDFDGAGIKTVLEIAEITHPLYGAIEVDAVAGFPESAWSHIEGSKGAEITFTGTLVRSDPLMRNVYVADAQIVD